MRDLRCLIKNPAWIAASHLTENIKSIERCCKYGAGAIVLKVTDGRLFQPCDRRCQKCKFTRSFKGRKLFFKKHTIYSFTPDSLICEFLSIKELEFFLSFLRKNYPDVFRIASVSTKNPKEFLKTARILKKYGIQILEINAKYTIRYKDSDFIDNKKYLLYLLKEISKKTNLPVILKICFDFGLLEEEFIKNASRYVNGLTITDSKLAILPAHFKKRLHGDIKKKTCAVAGEPLWKLVKKYVPIAKHYINFVSASGGIYSTKRAKEIMKLGANSVQLCSGIEFSGYKLISDIAREIKQ